MTSDISSFDAIQGRRLHARAEDVVPLTSGRHCGTWRSPTGRSTSWNATAAQAKPFYAYVPYTLVHYPTLPCQEFTGSTGHGDWADCLAQMDHNVGRLLDTVDRLGLRDDTVVVSTSQRQRRGPVHSAQTGIGGAVVGQHVHPDGRVQPRSVHHPLAYRVPADRVTDAVVHPGGHLHHVAAHDGRRRTGDRPIDGVDQRELLLGESETFSARGVSNLLR